MVEKNVACGDDFKALQSQDAQARTIGDQWSEDDILYLEDIFLTSGLHTINVRNVESGRTLMYTFLQSMLSRPLAACLTNQKIPLKKPIEDMYKTVQNLCKKHEFKDAVEIYFLEYFQAHLVWIESSDDFLQDPLVYYALQVIYDLEIVNNSPIIMLSYTLN